MKYIQIFFIFHYVCGSKMANTKHIERIFLLIKYGIYNEKKMCLFEILCGRRQFIMDNFECFFKSAIKYMTAHRFMSINIAKVTDHFDKGNCFLFMGIFLLDFEKISIDIRYKIR